MTDKSNNQYGSDSAETLFHDIATPLLIAKMKAGLLAAYLPNIIKSLVESPNLHHLLPSDQRDLEALIGAPDIMVSNLDVVQKKLNMLSDSVLHQVQDFGTHASDDAVSRPSAEVVLPGALAKTAAIKTILLVDDEVIHRDIGRSLLASHYQVDFAENGLEAVRMCEQKKYDLILMDLHMPKMNGEQATIALRARISNETLIIGLTSLPLGVNQSGLLAKGFTDFLEKPLTMKGLKNVLQTYAQSA